MEFGLDVDLLAPTGTETRRGLLLAHARKGASYSEAGVATDIATHDRVEVLTSSQRLEVTTRIDPSLRSLFGTGLLLGADEPTAIVRARGGWSGVHLTATGELDAVLMTGEDGIQPRYRDAGGDARRAPAALAPPPAADGVAWAASSSRDVVFRAGGMSGNSPSGELWKLAVSENTWRRVELIGDVLPGKALSAGYHYSTQSLYVLDEVRDGASVRGRLLRLEGSQFEVVASWPRWIRADAHLAVSDDGDLVVAFSRGGSTRLVVLRRGPTGWRTKRSHTLAGHLLARPQANRQWISLALSQGRKWFIRDLARTSLGETDAPCGHDLW